MIISSSQICREYTEEKVLSNRTMLFRVHLHDSRGNRNVTLSACPRSARLPNTSLAPDQSMDRSIIVRRITPFSPRSNTVHKYPFGVDPPCMRACLEAARAEARWLTSSSRRAGSQYHTRHYTVFSLPSPAFLSLSERSC